MTARLKCLPNEKSLFCVSFMSYNIVWHRSKYGISKKSGKQIHCFNDQKDSTGKEKIEGRDNVRSKGVVEKLLFGNTNGNVEFYVCPSFEGAYGFRTVRDSSDTFLLEIKRIANWKEAAEEA